MPYLKAFLKKISILFNPTHTYPFKKLEHPRYITLTDLTKHKVCRVAQKASVRYMNLNLLDELKRALDTFLMRLTKLKSGLKHFLSLISFATFLYQVRKVE
jgi:hypothetical protein